MSIEDLAYELFVEVHTRLDDHRADGITRDQFNPSACYYKAWIGIALALDARRANPPSKIDRWLDDYAFELFVAVSAYLHRPPAPTRRDFESIPPRKMAWIEIARVFEERAPAKVDNKDEITKAVTFKEIAIEGNKLMRFVDKLPTQYFTISDQRELRERLSAMRKLLKNADLT